MSLNTWDPPLPALPVCSPCLPVVFGVPGEKDGHVVMGRVEVTLGIDTLLPLTEAGQRLLCMVNYFQSLLRKEEEEVGMGSLPWSPEEAKGEEHWVSASEIWQHLAEASFLLWANP